MNPTPADLIQKASELLAEAAKMMQAPAQHIPARCAPIVVYAPNKGYLLSNPLNGRMWTLDFSRARRFGKVETAERQILYWQENMGVYGQIIHAPVDTSHLRRTPAPVPVHTPVSAQSRGQGMTKSQRNRARIKRRKAEAKLGHPIEETACMVQLDTGLTFHNPLAEPFLEDLSRYVVCRNRTHPRYAVVFLPLKDTSRKIEDQVAIAISCTVRRHANSRRYNHFHNIRDWEITIPGEMSVKRLHVP